ncbi:PIR Superfamily Protein [Plasmodium ovale curtisi]|uniref:PIR Superfamily Protein n=1 Tax=Plasmodium ovale curtisi TaxID=864141 RepID=A0A1A8WBX1_PLAOA|nr:PIR Superfamily Protein [Plasmodium ovale curtisi]
MPCYESHVEKYDLFNNIEEYMKYDNLEGQIGTTDSYNINCNFIRENYVEYNYAEHIPKLTDMCKKFVYLVESLLNKYQEHVPYNECDIDYLNYWLNNELTSIAPDKICKKSFYKNMLSKNNTNHMLRKLNGKILDIEENVLKDMNVLYMLYKYFKEIKEIISNGNSNKEDIIEHANKCVGEYKKFIQRCTEYKTNFCKALKIFKDKYEEINLCDYNLDKWKNEKLPALTAEGNALVKVCTPSVKRVEEALLEDRETIIGSVADPSHIDTKTITISVVATSGISFIFFILYKFTSFGQFLSYRMNNDENVWENMDEKMNNLSYTSDYEHINSEKTPYNIAYNSA